MFPQLYHAHHNRYLEDIPFWLELANQHGDPVLELGCGTGRVLLPLARAGHRVIGLDNNLSMLHFLRSHLEATLQPAPEVFVADRAAFRLAVRFPLIILTCNTFSTLPAEIRRVTLQCVRLHLKPGGLFATSVPNPRLLLDLPARSDAEVEDEFTNPLTGNPVQVSSAWRRTKTHFMVTWYYDHLFPDGALQRLKAEVRHELASAQVYLDDICAASLDIEAVYGDFDHSAYAPQSPYLLIIARAKSINIPE